MIQLILMILGLAFPNNNMPNDIQSSTTVQTASNSGEGLDTGGDTGPVRPPKI